MRLNHSGSVTVPLTACIVASLAIVIFASFATAGPDQDLSREWLIGFSIKSAAKAYIAVSDIDKLKRSNTDKLHRMSPDEYTERYARFYTHLNDLPSNLKTAYGILPSLDRSSAVKRIESMGKEDLYRLIDKIPDNFLAQRFDHHFSEKGRSGQRFSLEKVIEFWNSIRKQVE